MPWTSPGDGASEVNHYQRLVIILLEEVSAGVPLRETGGCRGGAVGPFTGRDANSAVFWIVSGPFKNRRTAWGHEEQKVRRLLVSGPSLLP